MAVTGVAKALESSNYQPERDEVCFFGVEIMLTSHKHNLVSTLSNRHSPLSAETIRTKWALSKNS